MGTGWPGLGEEDAAEGCPAETKPVISGADHPEEWMGKRDLKGVKLVRIQYGSPVASGGQMTTTARAATTRPVSGGNNSETGWHLDKGLLEEQIQRNHKGL